MNRKLALIAVGIVALLAADLLAAATPTLADSTERAAKAHAKVYIVQMADNPVVSYQGTLPGLSATRPSAGSKIDPHAADVVKYCDHLEASHDAALAAVGGRKVYGYVYSFNGFAAQLTGAQLNALSRRADVVRVWEDEIRQLTTDTTFNYLGLNRRNEVWGAGLTGEGVVIGVLDSGIWPEHPSFADVRTPKRGTRGPKVPFQAPPATWQGTACEFGNTAFNPDDLPFKCNNKLIGANFYVAGFTAAGLIPGEFLSARDNDGHGSHVTSTAGGNALVEASIAGEPLGKISGMAPRAHVASYKVCWNGTTPPPGFDNGCASSDSMAAIDQAIADGVDVINFSVGGPSTRFGGPDTLAFLSAAAAGVFVATSQGNSGPAPGTTGTPSGVPWITSVAATNDNQVFNLGLDVKSTEDSINQRYEGVESGISPKVTETGSVVGDLVLGNPLDGCAALTNGTAIAGQLAMIQRGGCAFSTKFLNAQAAGATGLVVFNNDGDPIVMGGDPTGIAIPGLMVSQSDGEAIETAILAGADTAATFGPDALVPKNRTVATFSSRGPNGGEPDIIKPDIAAPGVAILAGQTPLPNDGQAPGELFQFLNGTSMASPHIAGIGAILTQAHPSWSPAMIRSALMTTARRGLKASFGDSRATPFDVGAGLVNARHALHPSLVYDADLIDYVQYLCGSDEQAGIFPASICNVFGEIDPSDLNLPSIGVASLVGEQTVVRRVTNVMPGRPNKKRRFRAHVKQRIPGISTSVYPNTLRLAPGETGFYTVRFEAKRRARFDEWGFGLLEWNGGHGRHSQPVVSRMAVKPVQLDAPSQLAVANAGLNDMASIDVGIGFTGNLGLAVSGLVPADTIDATIETDNNLHFFTVPPGTRLAEVALFDAFVGDGTGSDDLDLQVQGPDTAGFPFVDFSGSPTSEESVTIMHPEPGVYAVFVLPFATVNATTNYRLFAWTPAGDAGNATATGPGSVSTGATEPVVVNWNVTMPDTKYRGVLDYDDGASPLGATVLRIDTAP